jgi:hypothetical protein
LGYWWWWLFVVPSLRSRRPKGMEKKALDIAFLGTPLISLLMPVVTKDTGIIWAGEYQHQLWTQTNVEREFRSHQSIQFSRSKTPSQLCCRCRQLWFRLYYW